MNIVVIILLCVLAVCVIIYTLSMMSHFGFFTRHEGVTVAQNAAAAAKNTSGGAGEALRGGYSHFNI